MPTFPAVTPSPVFRLFADDICVWNGAKRPTQSQIDTAARGADRRGWNGCALSLVDARGEEIDLVAYSEHALDS